MPRHRTPLQLAAGKLISALGKEWHKHLGEGNAEKQSETVLNKAHDLLQAGSPTNVLLLLNGKSVSEFLSEEWLSHHPQIMHYIRDLEKMLATNDE